MTDTNSPNRIARKASLKYQSNINFKLEDNYNLFDDKKNGQRGILSPNSIVKENLDDILSSMEYDKFKEKDAYNKDEFYLTLCTVAKRAKAFREMFMDKKPKYIKPIRPRVRIINNLSKVKSIGKIHRHRKSNQLHTTESESE